MSRAINPSTGGWAHRWLPEDDDRLRREWQTASDVRQLAREMGRTYRAVRRRASVLKLYRTPRQVYDGKIKGVQAAVKKRTETAARSKPLFMQALERAPELQRVWRAATP